MRASLLAVSFLCASFALIAVGAIYHSYELKLDIDAYEQTSIRDGAQIQMAFTYVSEELRKCRPLPTTQEEI